MNNERQLHAASVLSDGRVLVTGGLSNYAYLNSAELYNPSTGICTVTGSMNNPRIYYTASVLFDGRVLVTGGNNNGALNSVELYNLSTGLWTTTSSMSIARQLHTASVLSDGRVLVIVEITMVLSIVLNYIIHHQELGQLLAV